ncbi:MAG: hypothetical protein J5482_00835 [Oscillospiraceae bacterium]|nr:hypothetical protein [Oscillospiraceae bacterium]
MRFGKSSSNGALLRGDVRRCWPVPFVYAAIWIIALPLRLNAQYGLNARSTVLDTMEAVVILAFFFGCAMAMALMSYLMNSRATGLMHSLPVTRRSQFFTHFAAGFGMFTAANVLIFVLSVLVTLGGGVPWAALGWWLLAAELTGFFFLSLGFFSAILTGWLLAVPAVYLILNFGVWVITMLLRALGSIFYWGYSPGPLPAAVEWLTPTVKLCAILWEHSDYTPASYGVAAGHQMNTGALPVMLIYAAVGVLLLALGSFLYRIRRSEAAGDAVAHRGLRPVVGAVGALTGGLALGLVIYEILDGENRSMVTVCVVIMTALCYFTIEMLLKKSFRVFKSGWIRAALVCAAAAAVCVCVSQDLTGYQKRVPDPGAVQGVQNVTGRGYYEMLTDAETIEAVAALHQAIVTEGEGDATDPWRSFHFTYAMKSGAVVNRHYGVYVKEGSAIHEAANRVLNCPEVQWKQIFGGKDGKADAPGETPAFRGGYVSVFSGEEQFIQISAEQARTLYEALAADVLMGRNTHDILDEERECLWVEIELESADGRNDIHLWSQEAQLEKTCTQTLHVLTELGFTEEQLIGSANW